jgi:hypothetical protein
MISIRGTLLAGYVLLRFGSEKANPSALTLERISPLCHLSTRHLYAFDQPIGWHNAQSFTAFIPVVPGAP